MVNTGNAYKYIEKLKFASEDDYVIKLKGLLDFINKNWSQIKSNFSNNYIENCFQLTNIPEEFFEDLSIVNNQSPSSNDLLKPNANNEQNNEISTKCLRDNVPGTHSPTKSVEKNKSSLMNIYSDRYAENLTSNQQGTEDSQKHSDSLLSRKIDLDTDSLSYDKRRYSQYGDEHGNSYKMKIFEESRKSDNQHHQKRISSAISINNTKTAFSKLTNNFRMNLIPEEKLKEKICNNNIHNYLAKIANKNVTKKGLSKLEEKKKTIDQQHQEQQKMDNQNYAELENSQSGHNTSTGIKSGRGYRGRYNKNNQKGYLKTRRTGHVNQYNDDINHQQPQNFQSKSVLLSNNYNKIAQNKSPSKGKVKFLHNFETSLNQQAQKSKYDSSTNSDMFIRRQNASQMRNNIILKQNRSTGGRSMKSDLKMINDKSKSMSPESSKKNLSGILKPSSFGIEKNYYQKNFMSENNTNKPLQPHVQYFDLYTNIKSNKVAEMIKDRYKNPKKRKSGGGGSMISKSSSHQVHDNVNKKIDLDNSSRILSLDNINFRSDLNFSDLCDEIVFKYEEVVNSNDQVMESSKNFHTKSGVKISRQHILEQEERKSPANNVEASQICYKGERYYDDNTIYIGEFISDKRNGKGILYHQKGFKMYEGRWFDDKLHGNIKRYDFQGNLICEGKWRQGVIENQDQSNFLKYFGAEIERVVYKDCYYIGSTDIDEQCKKIRSGLGICFYKDGTWYKGEWLNDKQEHFGILYSVCGNVIYEGDWKASLKHGQGKSFNIENAKLAYNGNWHEDLKQGMGVSYYPDGKKKYEGEFVKNLSEGKGELFHDNGKISYSGDWVKDMKHGYGYSYDDCNLQLYKGEWAYDKREGEGVSYNKDLGMVSYQGDWKNNKKHGQGTFFKDGIEKYIGEWSGNKRHGCGKLFHDNSQLEYEGSWYNDKKHGDGKEYDEFGSLLYTGAWIANRKIMKSNGEKDDDNIIFNNKIIRDKTPPHSQSVINILYYDNGNKKYEGGVNSNGERNGEGSSWYEDSTIAFIGKFFIKKIIRELDKEFERQFGDQL